MVGARLLGWRVGWIPLVLGVAFGAGAADVATPAVRTLIETGSAGVRTTALPADAQVTVGVAGAARTLPPARAVAAPGPERVLIRLRGEPLTRARARGLVVAPQDLALQRQRAAAAILGVASQLQGRAIARGDVIVREYAQVFHGFAARLSAVEQARVRQLPDVAAVVPDTEVRAVLADSVPLVRAPDVWSSSGYRGAGVMIAVVDTGVDYTHGDLGACLGGLCKVVGGYDFVNGDADPRDDHGHGTHVAAIAAGNGSFVGVAPEARILAYKVLDAGGSGFTSNVIAGIERAVDPNQDGNTADHAAVINLSLGGSGNPDDPGSEAVDNASAAGVLVAVAAGNSFGFSTIGSPGTARTALTVGATDKGDGMADFSSRGPSPVIFGLKPEIVAPGVAICAARALGTGLGPICSDDTHIAISGTSMATPHVAGAAALLRGLFPARSVAEIKALLVENAVDLGYPVLEQGAGRLDVAAAAAAKTVVTPAAVSFGLDDLTQSTWTATESLSVRNLDGVSRSYTLGAGTLPAGITASFTPSSFTLAAGQVQTVAFELAVDNATVPNPPSAPFAYDGVVAVTSGTQQQRVPFVFIKSPVLRLHFDETPLLVVVHDRAAFGVAAFGTGTTADFLVPAGTFDAIVDFFDFGTGQTSIVVREGIVVDDFTEATIERAEAVHDVTFVPRDETDAPLFTNTSSRFLHHRASGAGIATAGGFVDFASGPLSDAYQVDLAVEAVSGPSRYFVTGVLADGIAGDRQLGNAGSDLTRAELSYHPGPGESGVGLQYFLEVQLNDFVAFGSAAGFPSSVLAHPLWVNAAPSPPFPLYYEPWAIAPSGAAVHRSGLIRGSPTAGAVDVFHLFSSAAPVYTTTTGELPLNLGPPFWFERFFNFPDFVSLAAPIGNWCWSFLGQGGDGPDAPGGTVPWTLRRGATEVASGALPQSGFGCNFRPFLGVTPGAHTFESGDLPYSAGGFPATTRVTARFDTTAGDPNPPWLEAMSLRAGGRLVDAVQPGTPVVLGLTVRDETLVSVAVSYDEGQGVLPVPVVALGSDRYEATIPACQGLRPVAVTVTATDAGGNVLRQDFTPAYACGTPVCSAACGPCMTCEATGCVPHPRVGCRTLGSRAEQASLFLKTSPTGKANRLTWQLRGQATAVGAFGDPSTSEDYALCIFDETVPYPALTFRAEIPATGFCRGPSCWRARGNPRGSRGYYYRNDGSQPDGITSMLLRPGNAALARIKANGKGPILSLPPLPLSLPSRVQLQAESGACWEARYTAADAARNDAKQFKGKVRGP